LNLPKPTITRIGFECSPRVLGIAPGTSGFSPVSASALTQRLLRCLSSFTLFFRVHQRSSCFASASVSLGNCSAPSVESLAPSVFSHIEQRLFPGSGFHLQSIDAYRCSQPYDVFFRPTSASLVSCWIHAWGSPLQSFHDGLPAVRFPLVQQFAVSDAIALMSL